ncbi:MAG: 3-deoxy-D-manno-octulosonic acid transferase [Cyanobacteria bacterium SIG29]|nr:3-deoxy-D-manno-octulosonic acid transferase [Cyanobacteria bacterium SIG29]
MMLIIYNIVLISVAITLLPLILIAFIVQPKFRAGFWEKIGFYNFDNKGKKSTVFHAVSVGETNAIKELVNEYRKKHPEEIIIVTTTTRTGQEIANKSFKDVVNKVTYYPYDFFFSVLSFLNKFNPEKIIIAETEIWPCFVTLAKLKGIKVYTINGRISPHSFDGYKKIKKLLSPVLNNYEKIYMQSNDDVSRMIQIGASQEKTEMMGNLKFDITQNLSADEIKKYSDELKTDVYRLFIGASTHKGEDEIVLKAFNSLKQCTEDAKLLLVPRHPQRYDEVCELLKNSGYKWGKRSNNDNFIENDIILLDTMGELSKLFSICHIAFIGGSFSSTGGHNPLEANIWSKPVISGPCTFNFKDVYRTVVEKKCAVIVNNEDEFKSELISFYKDNEKYEQYCKNAQKVFEENKGAINFVLERI